MKSQYLPPESEGVILLAESFVCASAMDKGNGAIDPVTPLDLNDDIWSDIL